MADSQNGQRAIDQLADEIAELAAHIHAATYRLLTCLREFDERSGWGGGFHSCAHWLSWRTGIAPGAAREKVRVARALAALPLLSEAMRRGELSFARARALTRVATAANEAELLEVARHATAAQTERIVRAWRRADTLEARLAGEEAHARTALLTQTMPLTQTTPARRAARVALAVRTRAAAAAAKSSCTSTPSTPCSRPASAFPRKRPGA